MTTSVPSLPGAFLLTSKIKTTDLLKPLSQGLSHRHVENAGMQLVPMDPVQY